MLLRTKFTVAALLFVLAPLALARGNAKPSTEPGSYKDWGPDIDQMEIVKSFKAGDYSRIVVVPFDTSKAALPDAKDRSYNSVKSAVDGYTETLTEALRDEVKGKIKVETAQSALMHGLPEALIVVACAPPVEMTLTPRNMRIASL